MTPEQLDEIEKLAEAATPGPWKTVVEEFHADSGAHQVALHDCFSEQDAEKNAAFISAMREHALPLVKALREARDYVADARSEAISVRATLGYQLGEARAEVERLKEEVRVAWAQKADSDVWRNRYRAELRNAEALLAALKEEHRPADELRSQLLNEMEAHAETKAEVERLRSALRLLWEEAQDESRCHHANGHMISQPCWETVTAALKEGEP